MKLSNSLKKKVCTGEGIDIFCVSRHEAVTGLKGLIIAGNAGNAGNDGNHCISSVFDIVKSILGSFQIISSHF